MSTNNQELRTSVAWETSGVDRGLQRVEQALSRMDKAESRSVTQQAAREAQAVQRQKTNRERALRDLERMEKDSAERRAKATEAAYKSADRAAQLRQAATAKALRVEGTAASRSSSGASGHSGGGGTARRMAGDALNAATGGSGNVMRLNMLAHMGPLLGGAAALAGMFAKGFSANSRMVQDTQSLRRSIGDRTYSDWNDNGVAAPIMRMLPSWMQSGGQIGRASTRSIEGMSAQREEISGGIEKLQGGRGYWETFGSQFGKNFSGHGRMEESFKEEETAQNKLIELDGKIAARIKEQTAARRLGVFESVQEGELAANRLEMEEKIAALDDKMGAGKISVGERMAGVKDAQGGKEIADFQSYQNRLAHDRGVDSLNSQTYNRGRGDRVALRSAYSEFQAADAAVRTAPTREAKAKANAEKNSRWQDVVEADRATRGREASQEIEQKIAQFRGGAEARTLHAAEQQLAEQEALLAIAKESGSEAARAAQIGVDRAKLTLDLTKQEAEARRIDNAAQIKRGNIQNAGARFGLSQESESQNGQIRFAAGQSVERKAAETEVQSAQLELERARAQVANEIAKQGQASEDTLKNQVLAQQSLNAAKVSQLATEKKLQFEAVAHARQLQTQLTAARAETGALKIGNMGRTDRADLARSRASTAAQALEAQRDGRPAEAAEIQEQQKQREIGLFDAKFLRPDGRRRRRSEINKEERAARKVENRRNRANSRLERDGGLVNVTRDMAGRLTGGIDPLTREKVSAEQLYARKTQPGKQAATERAAEQETMKNILSVLDARLPKVTQ